MTPLVRSFRAAALLGMPALSFGQDALDPDAWPRSYQVGGAEVAIYLPQIQEWSEFRHLKATAAVGVKMDGAAAIDRANARNRPAVAAEIPRAAGGESAR